MRLTKLLFCAAFAAIMVPAPAVQAQTSLRLAHQFAPDSLPGKSAARFAELVESKSGGAVTVTVLAAGALGDERANLQQLGSGTIDLALTGDLVISALARPYMIVSMPFIYDSPDHSVAVFNGPIGAEIGEFLVKEHKIRPLGWQYVGTRVVTSRTPVKSLAEIKGLKMRLPPAEMWIKTWEKTGVGIASIAFTELYLALQTGTVAAQENPPNFIKAQKYNEVQRYLMPTNHVPQMQVYFASEQKLAALDEKTRAVLAEAASEATAWTTEQAKASQEADIAWLTGEGGMELVEIDMTGIEDLIKTVPEEVLGADGTKLYERIRAAKP
jgi:tripartite ATP-independent transporter DctP family solute receptor